MNRGGSLRALRALCPRGTIVKHDSLFRSTRAGSQLKVLRKVGAIHCP